MVMVRRMSVDGMMMMVVVMMRTSDSSLLWRAGVGREAKRVEGSRGVLFRQAVVVMVMMMGMGMGVMVVVMCGRMSRLWSFATPLTGGWSISAVHTIAVLPCVFPQPSPSLSAVGVVVGIRLSSWTAA